jgi:hypothetical protein
MAAQMSQALIGKQIDYIPHTGIVVYGVEYFFGGGIQKMPPAQVESTFGLRPVKTEVLGTTDITQDVFHTFLAGISSRFTPETYGTYSLCPPPPHSPIPTFVARTNTCPSPPPL